MFANNEITLTGPATRFYRERGYPPPLPTDNQRVCSPVDNGQRIVYLNQSKRTAVETVLRRNKLYYCLRYNTRERHLNTTRIEYVRYRLVRIMSGNNITRFRDRMKKKTCALCDCDGLRYLRVFI